MPRATGTSAYDWPELHGDPRLTGYAANGSVTASNAGSLGVRWATHLYSAMLDSPVVAYDSSLGKTLAYIGTDNGNFYALDTATGAIVWDVRLPGPVRASPLVSNGEVWVTLQKPATIYKLDASTGAIQCSQALPALAFATPVAATPPRGTAAVYIGANRDVLSISAANCAIQWTFSAKATVWDPLAYAIDATGEPLVLFGDSDPDDSAYAVDAVTGKEVWRIVTKHTPDSDVGSGLTISPPGANGFAHGVAYVPCKDGLVYAVDLTTGAKLWSTSLGSYGGMLNESLSTAALDGTNLVVGHAAGVSDLNAVTGKLTWTYQTPVDSQIVPSAPAEVIASPAISGPSGQEVVAVGDVGGAFHVLSLATGHQLYTFQRSPGSWISASPAVSHGDILFGSTDGFFYDLSAGSGNDSPATSITSPASGSVVANPGGNLTVSGTASDSAGVDAVTVAIRQGGSDGMWWDAATSKWSATTVTQHATLASPGATSTDWSVSFPVPASGNAYRVDASTVSADGPSAVPGADDEFFVRPAAGGPALTASAAFAAPGGSVSVQGTGFGPKEAVTVSLLGQALLTVTSAADGSFPATKVTLPAGASFGPTALLATGATSGKAAAVGVYVTNSWPELGGSPGRVGFDANDRVDSETIGPAQNILLYPAWHLSAGAGLTSPAVVDQVVYAGDGSGTLHALRVRNGAQMWSWDTPDGAAITSSPAVDTTAGLAFVGAADGTLYAVHTSGSSAGTLAWSKRVGTGDVQAPVFGGTNVYAASAGGAVVALSKAAGSAIWSASTTSPVTGAPALHAGGGVLVVPTGAGLTALGITAGASLWNFAVPGATPPMLANGVVYVGSSNGHVYAVSESHGHQIWSTATGGAIQDSGALSLTGSGSASSLVIGSADGNLYSLNPSTGAKMNSWSMGSSTLGVVSDGGDTALVTTSSGLVEGVRNFKFGEFIFAYPPHDGALSPPALVDGTFFASGQSGTLYAFTPYGAPPP